VVLGAGSTRFGREGGGEPAGACDGGTASGPGGACAIRRFGPPMESAPRKPQNAATAVIREFKFASAPARPMATVYYEIENSGRTVRFPGHVDIINVSSIDEAELILSCPPQPAFPFEFDLDSRSVRLSTGFSVCGFDFAKRNNKAHRIQACATTPTNDCYRGALP
jgi:hypothetical protein